MEKKAIKNEEVITNIINEKVTIKKLNQQLDDAKKRLKSYYSHLGVQIQIDSDIEQDESTLYDNPFHKKDENVEE